MEFSWNKMAKEKHWILVFGIFLIFGFAIPLTGGIAVMSIDLGGEWIKVAIVKPGVPMEIAMNKESKRKTPNVVSLKDDERSFSDAAMSVVVRTPDKAYLYLTHIIGKKIDSLAVQLYRKRFPHYDLVEDEKRGTVLFQTKNKQKYSPEELLGMILNNSRHDAENFADHPMKDVVITVPVYFGQAERKAIINTAKLVGLNVLQVQNDNTAVALHYGIFRMATFNATEKHVMFFDMGATSTIVTVVGYSTVKVKDRGYVETVPQLVVKGVGFDSTLGGLAMDLKLRDHLVTLFKKQGKGKGDIEKNPRAMAKLLKEAKVVKQVLSANVDYYAQVENLFEGQDFKAKVTRNEFEEMCSDLFDRVPEPVKAALRSAAVPLNNIDNVILMGGGTRIPKVQEMLLKAVNKTELGKGINTDEAGALGAVYKAAELAKGFKVKRFLVKDVNLFPIDVSFIRQVTNEKGEPYNKVVTRTLFHHLNPLPQKKVMTFNKKPEDFSFNVSYGDMSFLEHGVDLLGLGKLSEVQLNGVTDVHQKNKEYTSKGVKAYFNMDESGILHLEKVESHFETVVGKEPKEEEQSTFAKIGSTLSSLFGTSTDDKANKEEQKPEEKYEEAKGEEEKKDEKPADKPKEQEQTNKQNDAKKEEKEEKKESKNGEKNKTEKEEFASKESDKNATNVKNTTSEDNNVTKAEKPIPKPVLIKEDVSLTLKSLDIPDLAGETFEASEKLLIDFQRRDDEKRATEKARNSLETFVFEFRERLFEAKYDQLSGDQEKRKISEHLSKASEWLEEEGWDATIDVFKAKLKELKELTLDLRGRMSEFDLRPKAIEELLNSLNLSSVFLQQVKVMPGAEEIYTEKDLKDIGKVYTESLEWLMVNWKKQNESDPKLKPVMLVKDIINIQGKVDRELMYLINKAKYYVPKPKPKTNETAKNTTKPSDSESQNTTKSDGEGENTNTSKASEKTETPASDSDSQGTKPKSEGKKGDDNSKNQGKNGGPSDNSAERKPEETPSANEKDPSKPSSEESKKKENAQDKGEEKSMGTEKSSKAPDEL